MPLLFRACWNEVKLKNYSRIKLGLINNYRNFAIKLIKLSLAEVLLVLPKLNIARLINIFKVLSSFYISRLLAKPIQWGLPISLSVEPTTACNLRCPECPSGLRSFSRPTGNLNIDEFKKWIDPYRSKIWGLTFYFQGEPFIHPEITEAIHYAHRSGIYTMSSTNGHFLNKVQSEKIVRSGLDRLIISIDGTDQQTYEQYRKEGNLKQVLTGVRNIVKAKQDLKSKTPYLIFQFLVVKPNEHQIPDIYQLAKDYEVNEVKLKTAQIYDFANGSDFIPEQAVYSRYKKVENGSYQIKNKFKNHCWKLWHSPVITWDGKLVPCCFDKDALHQMGDLSFQNLKSIWENETYLNFRNKLMKSRKSIEICKNCTEGTKVWG